MDEGVSVDALGGDDTISGGLGVDILKGGVGDDTYIFARGDGVDTIIDTAGDDTIKLAEGISKDDLIIKADGKDIILALKEDGKTFEELSDKITISNWLDTETRVENIILADATTISLEDVQKPTDGDKRSINKITYNRYKKVA